MEKITHPETSWSTLSFQYC